MTAEANQPLGVKVGVWAVMLGVVLAAIPTAWFLIRIAYLAFTNLMGDLGTAGLASQIGVAMFLIGMVLLSTGFALARVGESR